MACLDDDYTWHPPTEAELKVFEARRERNNKISSLMGQYLLKGYKMLAICCTTCDCVLLEDRGKVNYCIGCSEVDADTRKDNPAVNEEAARKTVEEIQHRQPAGENNSAPSQASAPEHTPSPAVLHAEVIQSHAASSSQMTACISSQSSKNLCIHGVDLSEDVMSAVSVLRDKLTWATSQLRATTSVHEAHNIAGLITESCKAITALRDL